MNNFETLKFLLKEAGFCNSGPYNETAMEQIRVIAKSCGLYVKFAFHGGRGNPLPRGPCVVGGTEDQDQAGTFGPIRTNPAQNIFIPILTQTRECVLMGTMKGGMGPPRRTR